jgi:hypothetical protein
MRGVDEFLDSDLYLHNLKGLKKGAADLKV